jgi:hypothetical protein
MTGVEQLYDMLKRVQEPKGYYFNRERERVDDLLAGLLVNRERTDTCAVPAASLPVTATQTGISSAPASTGRQMFGSMAAVIAILRIRRLERREDPVRLCAGTKTAR